MSPELQALIEAAWKRPFSAAERDGQPRSFAYGNAKIEIDRITHDVLVEHATPIS